MSKIQKKSIFQALNVLVVTGLSATQNLRIRSAPCCCKRQVEVLELADMLRPPADDEGETGPAFEHLNAGRGLADL